MTPDSVSKTLKEMSKIMGCSYEIAWNNYMHPEITEKFTFVEIMKHIEGEAPIPADIIEMEGRIFYVVSDGSYYYGLLPLKSNKKRDRRSKTQVAFSADRVLKAKIVERGVMRGQIE